MDIWAILKLIGSLALLMYGMKSMSESLQKMAGSTLRHILQAMTKVPILGVLTGAFVTAFVQSSTATTVMTVSFVNASLLSLGQAISIIMGANIGTTFTAWIMTLGFGSFNITNFVYPMFAIGIVLIYLKKRKVVGDFLFGLALLLLGLGTLKATGTDMHLESIPAVMNFFQSFGNNYGSYLLFMLIGGVLTFCVQSSAAIMAITMTLCSTGVLPIHLGIALVMGENIGTTVTSNIAALTANTQARRAAFAHMFFNVFGVLWMLIVFVPFINFICDIWGYPTENATNADAILLPMVLATFHTGFNIINTAVLIWFIPIIEKIVCFVIKNSKKNTEDEESKLNFITGGILATPELSVLEARKEIQLFAERIQRMFGMVADLLNETNDEKFVKIFTRIEKYERITDNMEHEIAKYLDEVSDNHLSDETKGKIRAMLREISELESIGDSCYNLARTINRKKINNESFNDKQLNHISQMLNLTNNAITQMSVVLAGRKDTLDINRSINIENEINNYRDQLRAQNITDVNNHVYTYATGTLYMDIVCECEKLGDYVINVVEAHTETKNK